MGQKWNAAESLAGFACRLYGTLDRTSNLFFSPHSVSAALSLAYLGAHGETATQMASALGYPSGDGEDTTRALMALAVSEDDRIRLSAANSVWVQRGYRLLDEYLRKVGGMARETDFRASKAASDEINAWIAEHTSDLIRDLVPPGALGALTRLVLANAIHFKGAWATAFDKRLTRKMDFHNLDGSVSQVDTMFARKVKIGHVAHEEYEAGYLPYGDGSMGMLVVIPNDFADFTVSLDGARLLAIRREMRRAEEVDLGLPRFRSESTLGLSGNMAALGMVDAFDDGRADFSGISGERDLVISAILHKALVDVSEEGTEAAAATAVVMRYCCMVRTPRLDVDRPFVFAICRHDGAPLFMGQTVSL